jgi:hypothetical protein
MRLACAIEQNGPLKLRRRDVVTRLEPGKRRRKLEPLENVYRCVVEG